MRIPWPFAVEKLLQGDQPSVIGEMELNHRCEYRVPNPDPIDPNRVKPAPIESAGQSGRAGADFHGLRTRRTSRAHR